MALTKCKECGHQISNKAKTCPNCGAPTNRKDFISSLARRFVIIFIIVPVGVAIFLAVYHSQTEGTSPSSSRSSKITLKRKDYGDAWPYPKYSTALLDCNVKSFGSTHRPLVIIKLGAKWYGVNGAAIGAGGYPDSREQMDRDLASGIYRMGASDEFLKKGLSICGSN